MKKFIGLIISTLLILNMISCKMDVKGSTETVHYQNKEVDAYVFDSLDDIRDSLKAILKDNLGKAYSDISFMENDFDQKKDSFVFNEERYKRIQSPSYYYYPDFSTVDSDYIVIWDTKKNVISNDQTTGIETYYNTYAIWIFKFDREKQICSEPVVVDSGIKVTSKI